MKNFLLLLSIFSLLVSCSKDNLDDNSVQGKWMLQEWTVKEPLDLNNDGNSATSFSPGCLDLSTLEFSGNGDGELFWFSSVSYNTRIENNQLFIMTACSTSSSVMAEPITYEESGNGLVIHYEGNEYQASSNESILYFNVPNGFIARDQESGEITISRDVTYIFIKE